MPFALLIVGAFLLISAARNTSDELYNLLKNDFSGPGNFVYWFVAILLVGALGYIPKVKPVSVAFIGLLILVLVLAKGDPAKAGGGFFEKFTQGLAATTAPLPDNAAPNTSAAAAPTAKSTLEAITSGGMLQIPQLSNLVH